MLQLLGLAYITIARLQLTSRVEIDERLRDTGAHGLLTFPDPYARIIVLLVGLIRAFGIADLRQEVVLLIQDVVADTDKVCPLEIGV